MNRTILTIAGSDSGGGAGVQIDSKTAERIGCFSTTVITALTAQNRREVRLVEQVSLRMIEAQFRAVVEDFSVGAVKLGMMGDADTVRLVARLIREYELKNIVIDPVLIATSGGVLGSEGTTEAILEEFLPLASVLTPNEDEAEVLCGLERGAIASAEDGLKVWKMLREKGLSALLLKGGHGGEWQERGVICDTLFEGDCRYDFRGERLDIAEVLTHGTGCTLSSAVACYLALGSSLEEACKLGTEYVQSRLRSFMKG